MNLKQFLTQASEDYYAGNPSITDTEYDALEKLLGEQLLVGEKDIYQPHAFRMYSLDKHYPERDGVHFLQKQPQNKVVTTPKLDGLATSILFHNGKLVEALTRGDGIKGRPITNKLELIVGDHEPNDEGIYQVTGELVARLDVENSRNAASGAIGIDDLTEFEAKAKEIGLVFVAYDIVKQSGENYDTYTEKLNRLNMVGFETILTVDPSKYPLDGTVIRLDSEKEFANLGHTDKFPRGAVALKKVTEEKETTLLDVIWQTGGSGRITPVAILHPVELGGATVSRATLNNIAYIRALELEIGDTVKVVRAGEIIPKIVGKSTS